VYTETVKRSVNTDTAIYTYTHVKIQYVYTETVKRSVNTDTAIYTYTHVKIQYVYTVTVSVYTYCIFTCV
jgi:hypothetical protein